MKKLFISLPMKGKTKEEIISEIERIKEKILGEKYEIINSIVKESALKKFNPIRRMSESIKYLSEADVVFFAKWWEESRGCRVESHIAYEYWLEILYERKELHSPWCFPMNKDPLWLRTTPWRMKTNVWWVRENKNNPLGYYPVDVSEKSETRDEIIDYPTIKKKRRELEEKTIREIRQRKTI